MLTPIATACIVRYFYRILQVAAGIVLSTAIAHGQIEWQPASQGLEGGRVSVFAFDSSASGNVYAGSRCDLFRFDRESNRWVVAAEHLPAKQLVATRSGALVIGSDSAIFRIASIGGAPERVASLGVPRSIVGAASGTLVAFVMPHYLIRSTDDGSSWSIVDSTPLSPNGSRRVFVSREGTFFTIGTGMPLTRSLDDGRTWEALAGIPAGRIHTIFSAGASRLLAVGHYSTGTDSLYQSTDNGTTWRAIPVRRLYNPTVGAGNIIHAFGPTPAYPYRIHLYSSSDLGSTWTDQGEAGLSRIEDAFGVGPTGELWTGVQGRVLRSSDAGLSWEDRTEGLMALAVPQIVADSSGRLFAVAGGQIYPSWERTDASERLAWGTLYQSVDEGRTWEALLPQTRKIHGDLDNGMLYVSHGLTPGIVYSRDYGLTWDSVTSQVLSFGGVDDNRSGKIVMTFAPAESQTQVSEVVVSTDRGMTWNRTTQDGSWYSPTVLETGRILVQRFLDNATDMMTSIDDGASWQVLFPEINVRDIKVDPSGEIFLVGLSRTSANFVFYRSTDDGATWELRYEFLQSETRWGWLALVGHGDFILKQTTLRSRDAGRSWESAGPREVADGDIISAPDGTLYAYTPAVADWIIPHLPVAVRSSIYRSTDFGDTWSRHEGPVPLQGSVSIAFTPSGRMFVGTNGCGIYSDGAVSRVVPQASTPLSFSIDAVEPNPISGKTFARITIARRQEISLTMCDMAGRELAVLHDGVVEAGSSKIAFDASELGSGTYILSLRGADGIASHRVVVQP